MLTKNRYQLAVLGYVGAAALHLDERVRAERRCICSGEGGRGNRAKSSSPASAPRCRIRSAAKRDNIAFSDSIFAEDIGKFPDLNLAESLQRIPGVQIARDFTGEGTSVAVRGLGKRLHADHAEWRAGRNGLGQQHRQRQPGPRHRPRAVPDGTVPPVDGEQDPDRQPAGRRRCREHRPAHRAAVRRQRASTSTTPPRAATRNRAKSGARASAFYASNTWDTGIGEFGILGGVAYSNRKYRSDGFNTIGFTTCLARQPLPVCHRCRSATASSRLTTTPVTATRHRPGRPRFRPVYSFGANGPTAIRRRPADRLRRRRHAGRHLGPVVQRPELCDLAAPRAPGHAGRRARNHLGNPCRCSGRRRTSSSSTSTACYSKADHAYERNDLNLAVRSTNTNIPLNVELNEDNVVTSATIANPSLAQRKPAVSRRHGFHQPQWRHEVADRREVHASTRRSTTTTATGSARPTPICSTRTSTPASRSTSRPMATA